MACTPCTGTCPALSARNAGVNRFGGAEATTRWGAGLPPTASTDQ
ncbi:MAG: hypothetical protein QG597_2706 [Actinomycetota bacterium]|nr:hypothetical protein [Actinomycetota bacterium]